jgi:hypothetical protein
MPIDPKNPGFYKEALNALKRRVLGPRLAGRRKPPVPQAEFVDTMARNGISADRARQMYSKEFPSLSEVEYIGEMTRRGMSVGDARKAYMDIWVRSAAGKTPGGKAHFKKLRESKVVPKGESLYGYEVKQDRVADAAALKDLATKNEASRAAYEAKYRAPVPEAGAAASAKSKKLPWILAGTGAASLAAAGGIGGYMHYRDKAASDEALAVVPEQKPRYVMDVPTHTPAQIAAAGLSVPSVLAGVATHKVSKPLDKALDYQLSKKFDPSAKQWLTIAKETDPGAVIRRYSRVGNELMNTTVKYQGKLYTAKEVLDQLRGGPHGKILERAGLNPPYTPESIQHYEQFTKSPTAAYRQLWHERGLSDKQLYDTLDYQKNLRYKAITSAKRNTPQEVAAAIADAATKEKKLTPAARKYLYEAALRDEMRLIKADSQLYNKYLETAAKVPSDPNKYNPIQKQMEDSLFGKSTVSRQDMRTAAKRALGKRTGFAQAVLETEMQKGLQEAADGGYSKIVGALQQGKRIRKKARIGRYVVAPGLILGGLGGAYYGLSRPRGTVQGRMYNPPKE